MAVDIAAENALTAGRETWPNLEVWEVGDLTVAGFAREISYNVGETAQFSVTGDATVIDIYRVGWYGGDGFRRVATITNTPTNQPEAVTIPNSNGATTCTGWSVTASWQIPSNATSGLYLALVRSVPPQAPNAFYITFVVRDDAAEADIIYKTSDSTWGAAYNYYGTKANPLGGKNVYGEAQGVGNIMLRSFSVSYHRPVVTRKGVVQTYWTACEWPIIRFLERNGYRIKYVTCVDLDDQGINLLRDKGEVFFSSGHDEYWTAKMRTAVETFRDVDGGKSIFMAGNEVFWKARYETMPNGEKRMWCYKDTMPGPNGVPHNPGEPLDPVEWTGTWKDTRWPGRKPEWLLTGTDFRMNGIRDENATIVRNPYGGHKVWGGSALVDGDITLTRAVGFEADSMRPTQPNESVRVLAAYTRNIDGWYADDNGQNYTGNGNLEWGVIAQRYESGALTVGFGTCQWGWMLDAQHERGAGTPVSPAAQQMLVNLLNDLEAEPQTLMSGLTLRPRNNLDEYGIIPTNPETPSRWRLADGSAVTPFTKINGQLTPLS